MTNDFDLPAITIAELYRERWKIELFFKWIRQHLRIKVFYGTSPNAVYCQIWIAICAYLLIKIANKKLNLAITLYTFAQTLGLALFEKILIKELFKNKIITLKTCPMKTICHFGILNRTAVFSYN
jgi:hypothetical protein